MDANFFNKISGSLTGALGDTKAILDSLNGELSKQMMGGFNLTDQEAQAVAQQMKDLNIPENIAKVEGEYAGTIQQLQDLTKRTGGL